MPYVEIRHSGISHDLKTEMDIIPRLGEVVDFQDGEDKHVFRVDRVVYIYEDHKLTMIHIYGQKMENWLG